MNKFALLVLAYGAAAAVSGVASAKDTGFSSTFPGNAAAGYNTLSPAAGSSSDTQQKTATSQTTAKHKKKHHVMAAPISAQ